MTELKLGRGLKDLIDENVMDIDNEEKIVDISIVDILPNPDQPRSVFDIEGLNELAESIKEHGVIQPIIVKPSGDKYIIVAGERRVRASKLAGINSVPSVVRDYNSVYLAELAILENLQREDLTPIEEALAFSKLLTVLGTTHEELGKRIGKSRSYITNTLGLLNLPAALIDDVNSGLLSMGHARALSKLDDIDMIIELRDKIISEHLSVRELEKILKGNKEEKVISLISNKTIKSTRQELSSLFGDRFKYKISKKSITLSFTDEKELEEIMEFLKRRG